MPTVVICGALGTNIGDAAISQCLAEMACVQRPGITVVRAGLGGQPSSGGWDEDVAGSSPLPPRLSLEMLPLIRCSLVKTVANSVRWHIDRAHRQQRMLDEILPTRDSVLIVGGGQLLMDMHLGFPLYVRGLLNYATARRVPAAVVSCGVEPSWSHYGRRLFRQALTAHSVRHISTRDALSLQYLHALVPRLDAATRLTPDPALCIADFLPLTLQPANRLSGRAPVALVPIAPRQLSHPTASGTLDEGEQLRFWCGLARCLAKRYAVPIRLVTTGKPADATYAESVYEHIRNTSREVEVRLAPRPTSVSALASQIASCSLVIAFRLHALIIATSYGVPWIALGWDGKVASFAALTRREAYYVDQPSRTVDTVAELSSSAFGNAVSPTVLKALKDSARDGVAAALTACGL